MHGKSRFADLQLPKLLAPTSVNSLDQISEEGTTHLIPATQKHEQKVSTFLAQSRDDSAAQDISSEQKTPLVNSPLRNRRGNSMLVFKHVDLLRIKRSEKEGFLQPANFTQEKKRSSQIFRGIHERNAKLNEILADKQTKIDLSQTEIQQLSVEIARKAIKTQLEIQFMLRTFYENGVFSGVEDFMKRHKSIVIDINYEFHAKNSIIYETGDFELKYYLILQGRLAQLLPSTQEIVNSPTKLAYPRLNNTHNKTVTETSTTASIQPPNSQRPSLLLSAIRMNASHHNNSSNNNHTQNSPSTQSPSGSASVHLGSNSASNSPRSAGEIPTFDTLIPHHVFNKEIIPGTHFGDSELLSRRRRGFSVYCLEDSHVLSISKEVFERIMGGEKQKLIREKLEFFKQFDFLQGVGDSKLMEIIDTSILISANMHQQIYEENAEADSLYFIVSGEVQLSKINEASSSSFSQQANSNSENLLRSQASTKGFHIRKLKKGIERVPIMILVANTYFGEREIVKNTLRDTQAVCTSLSAQILSVSAKKLMNIVKQFGKYELLQQRESSRQQLMISRIELVNTQKNEQSELRLKLGFQQYPPASGSATSPGIISPAKPLDNSNQSIQVHAGQTHQINSSYKGRRSSNLKGKSESSISLGTISLPTTAATTTTTITVLPTGSSNRNLQMSSTYFFSKSSARQSDSLSPSFTELVPKKSNQRIILDKIQQKNHSSNSLEYLPTPYSGQKMNSSYSLFYQHTPSPANANVGETSSIGANQNYPGTESNSIKKKRNLLRVSSVTTPFGFTPNRAGAGAGAATNVAAGAYQSNTPHLPNGSNMQQQQPEQMMTRNNIFQCFVESAEKRIQQKQAILNKLMNVGNSTTQSTPQNMSNTSSSNILNQNIFQAEFDKGFHQMYLRKFGKPFQKK